MSDKFEQKKQNNLTKIDFKNKIKQAPEDEFISKSEVHSILSKNFGRISSTWFKFISNWNYNAYKTFHDMDKYLILVYLVQKSLRHYADIFVIYSEQNFYSKPFFEIEKINLIEISQELEIPKETVRRKINEMNNEGILVRKGKKITITMSAFQTQRPKHSIKSLSIFLSNVSKYLATEDWFGSPVKAVDIEDFTRDNFTLVWRFFFRLKIPMLIRQRKFHGDLETFVVAGTVFVNHMHRLKEIFADNPIIMEKGKDDDLGVASYHEWLKIAIFTKEKIIGVNASSISEITGIPRATVIRKLRQIEKKEILHKEDNLYTLGRHYKKNIKNLEKVFIENQIDLCKFIATFFELYKNKKLKS